MLAPDQREHSLHSKVMLFWICEATHFVVSLLLRKRFLSCHMWTHWKISKWAVSCNLGTNNKYYTLKKKLQAVTFFSLSPGSSQLHNESTTKVVICPLLLRETKTEREVRGGEGERETPAPLLHCNRSFLFCRWGQGLDPVSLSMLMLHPTCYVTAQPHSLQFWSHHLVG